MSFDTCKVCPEIIPLCSPCNPGYTCVIIAQSCHNCSYTECLDNAQVSSGHYTIASTGAIGPISSTVSVPQTTTASMTTDTTSMSSTTSASSTTAASTTTSGTSTSSAAATTSGIAISSPLSSVTSSVSTQASSVTSSSATATSTGAAATIGPHTMEGQGLFWIVMAFWMGTAVFGGRRWRM